MTSCYPFTRDRIIVLPNPTDFKTIDELARSRPEFKRTGSGPVLISVGRLSEAKRYDVLLEALLQVRQRIPAEWWLCGDGPERRKLRRRAEQLGVAGYVRWLGHCQNPFPLMRQADLFVMSSDYEGLPNALIEAQGLGLPAVSTNCPYGPDEIIEDGVTGLLTPVGDAHAIAHAVFRMLDEPASRQRMGDAARNRARKLFGVDLITRQWEEMLLYSVSRDRVIPG
jgi:glycosyltransferase involved in cell wall biosynthesis